MSINWGMGLNNTNELADAFAKGQQRRMAADLAKIEEQRKAEIYRQTMESRERMRTALENGDRYAAADEALVMGDHEVATGWRQLDEQRLKRDDYYSTRRAEMAYQALQLSPEERLVFAQQNRRIFAELGVDVDGLTAEDLSDPVIKQWAQHGYKYEDRVDDEREAYEAQTGRYEAETGRIEAEAPVKVGQGDSLVTQDGSLLYRGPTYEGYGMDENVYEIPGTETEGYATTTVGGGLGVEDTWSRMIHTESRGRQHDSSGRPLTSSAGAIGIAQVMPATAREVAREMGIPFDENRYRNDAEYNARLGRFYYEKMLRKYGGDTVLAAAAYNAGPGNVDRALRRGGREDFARYLPQETQGYIRSVHGSSTRTTGQRTTSGGIRQVQQGREKPTSGGAANAEDKKQQGQARKGLAELDAIDSQIAEVEALLPRLEEDGWSGAIGGLVPANWDKDSDVYEAAIGLLRPMLKGIIRQPGEGVWTDADQRVLDRALPTRQMTPEGRRQAIKQARQLLNSKRAEYSNVSGDSPAPRSQSQGRYRIGQTATNKRTGQKMVYTANGWVPQR